MAIDKKFGFKPEVLVLSSEDLSQAVENNPYDSVDGKTLHFYFCKTKPKFIKTEKLQALKAESEEYSIKGKVFYLYAPNGIGRSKLAANVEKYLGVPVTARNLNTINKLSIMVKNA